jgi:hypothetical protein
MVEIKCVYCVNAITRYIDKQGTGKGNLDVIKKTECDLGFEIRLGGIPGPGCDGKYFEQK